MGIYHQVYQLKRNPEVPCSPDTAEETHIEILEMPLKKCLWHRWGPAQPEEPGGRSASTRTTRMPAQAELHAQMQVTYDHFGHF